jgi:hypothetical protein
LSNHSSENLRSRVRATPHAARDAGARRLRRLVFRRFEKAKLGDDNFDVSLNCFAIESGQSRAIWQEKGWITVDDPLGWFQWYCRYVMGRRLVGVDNLQIKRWRSFGPRHAAQIRKNCQPGDIFCRRRQRQGLLQWAYDPFI